MVGSISYGGGDDGIDRKTVYTFSQGDEVWKEHNTTGTPPPKLFGGACTSAGDTVYYYGGGDQDGRQAYYGELYSLDTAEMKWREVQSVPMKGSSCGIVHLGSKFITFGGHGPQPFPTQPGAAYQEHYGGKGLNNELHILDLEELGEE